MPVYRLAVRDASCASPGCWCRDRARCYPSDLDDGQWAVLEPQARAVMAELTVAAGRPMTHDLRAMCDAVFYVVRNGVEWRGRAWRFPPLEVVRRCDPHAFQVVRRRWVVERTFGWLMRYRRLARDYERLTAHHEAMVYWATIMIMTRRLAPATRQGSRPNSGGAETGHSGR